MNTRRTALLMIRITADAVMVTLSWILAYYIRFAWLDSPKGIPEEILYFKLTPFIVVIWVAVFAANGFFRRSMKRRSAFVEALDILQSCALAMLAFIAFTYFYEEHRYSRAVLLVFAVLHRG